MFTRYRLQIAASSLATSLGARATLDLVDQDGAHVGVVAAELAPVMAVAPDLAMLVERFADLVSASSRPEVVEACEDARRLVRRAHGSPA